MFWPRSTVIFSRAYAAGGRPSIAPDRLPGGFRNWPKDAAIRLPFIVRLLGSTGRLIQKLHDFSVAASVIGGECLSLRSTAGNDGDCSTVCQSIPQNEEQLDTSPYCRAINR